MRLLPLLATSLLSVASPAHADQLLDRARIDGANRVIFPGGATLGEYRAGVYTAKPDRLVLPDTDQGSTGDASGFKVRTSVLPAGQSLASWLTSPVFGAFSGQRVRFDPMGLTTTNGDRGNRGPLFVWNNPNGSTPAGQNGGLQVWIGDNPTATPGVGDTVGGTVVVVNGNNRQRLYGLNVFTQVCNAGDCGGGYQDAKTTGIEVEAGTGYPNTPTDPWSSAPNRKNGIELTAQSGSRGRITSGMMTWANDNSGVGWWNTGLALSRVADVGILAKANPNGTIPGSSAFNADTVHAFATAVLYDLSNSGATIKVGPGTHESTIDLSSATAPGYFVKGMSSVDTVATFGNAVNRSMAIGIDSGNSVSRSSDVSFSDRGSVKWLAGKDADQAFRIFDATTGLTPFSIFPGTNIVTLAKLAVGGGTVDATAIGTTTPAAGSFTSLTAATATIGGDVNVGGGSNTIGVTRALSVNAASGSTGVMLERAGQTVAHFSADGTTYAQIMTANTTPLTFGVNGASKLKLDQSFVQLTVPQRLAAYTVAALPACNAGLQDALLVVTDAFAPTYRGALTGGGSVRTPAYCDGAIWTAH
ncbi:MAG: hypothetical protein K2Y56_25710 [Methylobacterium sp.]|uniref:hypothetical protein n=1 Tax=Methylobacterium sp. TaxID=409 RepID=UPI0025CEE51F|nr:hypothetical protein [Methylobacterium sp.]MBX9934865.1 hypothetical protein [Methylobacterium sp.]